MNTNRARSGMLVFALAVALSGCDVPKTLTPSVELSTSVPLMDERIEIGEEVAKVDSVQTVGSNPARFVISLNRDRVDLTDGGRIGSDQLRVDDQTPQSITAEMGLISVADVPPTTTPPVVLADLVPDIASMPPGNVPLAIPAYHLPTVKRAVDFSNFQQATFSSSSDQTLNRVVISLANDGPLPMGPVTIYVSTSGDTMVTSDGSFGTIKDAIAQADFPVIQPGDSVSSTPLDLSGATLRSPAHVFTRAQTQAGTATGNQMLAASFTVTVDISALEVESARAKIPRQTFSRSREVNFASDRIQIYSVKLARSVVADTNRFTLNIVNNLNTPLEVSYDLPDFTIPRTPVTGAQHLQNVSVGSGGASDYARAMIALGARETKTVVFDLSDAVIENPTAPKTPIDRVRVNLTTTVLGTGDTFVDIVSTDYVQVGADMSALAVQRVEGNVAPSQPPINVTIQPVDFDVTQNLPAGLTGLAAEEITVELDVTAYETQVDADIGLVLTVANPAGGAPAAQYTKTFSQQFRPGVNRHIRVTQDSLDAFGNSPVDIINAALNNLFASGQTKVEVSGNVNIRGEIVLVRDSSRVDVKDVRVESPLKFTVPQLTFDAKAETEEGFEIDIDESVRNDLVPRARSATLVADVENHFPMGATLVVFASPDPLFSTLRALYPASAKTPVAQIPDTLRIPQGGPVTGEADAIARKAVFKLFTVSLPNPQRLSDGRVDHANPGRATVEVRLDDQLQLFSYEKLYLMPRIQLLDAPGLVQLSPSDYVKVAIWMQIAGATKR